MYKKQINDYVATNSQEIQDKKVILDYIERFGDSLLTRENEFAHFTSSGFIVNETFDKVLMIYHNLYQSWSWTGGHADGNFDFLAVAMQEAMEETGVVNIRPLSEEIMAIDILPVWGHVKKGQYVSSHLHLNVSYLLIASEEDTLKIKPDENSKVGWLPIGQISTYCDEPQMLPVYEKLIKRLLLEK